MLSVERNLIDVSKNPQSIVAWARMRMWIRPEKVSKAKYRIIYQEGYFSENNIFSENNNLAEK